MPQYASDDERWLAVQARDRHADTHFFYGVITTGVYCYPSCASRGARREHVRYFTSRATAEQAGLRACKRCRPDEAPLAVRQRELVERACRLVEQAGTAIRVDDLAAQLSISRFHLQKLFVGYLGISPKAYIQATRAQQLNTSLANKGSVTDAVFEAGYVSTSSFYAQARQRLGMRAKDYQRKGKGVTLQYAFGESTLGLVLVATTDKGICCVLFGDSQPALEAELQKRFAEATRTHNKGALESLLKTVLAVIDEGSSPSGLPLDIQGTAFQQKVWQALQAIPAGETRTYAEIAQAINQPKASRAVAQACGANPTAVIVPCHRVVRADGTLSGYRWGVERKSRLLASEGVRIEEGVRGEN